MTYNLFIDDERDPIDVKWGTWQDQVMYRDGDWIIARNWNEVLDIVVTIGFPQMISFDHDLGENQKTGFDIAKRLWDMIQDGVQMTKGFEYRVHSKNPVGAENIHSYMSNFMEHYVGTTN